MADNYIDYLECLEYGGHLVREGMSLIDASPVVNVDVLLGQVADAARAVALELDKVGVKASALRGERGSIDQVASIARATLHGFFHHLRVQRVVLSFDFEAFFARQAVGKLARLKPADLLGKMDSVLRGFAAPGNADVPGAAEWQKALGDAREALDRAVSGRGTAKLQSIKATAGLIAARQRFLARYRLAKRIIRALLDDLGRGHELALFFLDLQVNESGGGEYEDDGGQDDGDPDGSGAGEAGELLAAIA